ncbi:MULTISPECIES: hypothetical protein [unclassified Kitasatospora]|uniref:hypothetical protein n=1 Tax=unclassified Kitasatospora TaxID=2633591 RepID=UPI000AD5193C|nr:MULTISPECIES: hypothetical protein [unclassified Kitasatospora]
MPTRLLTSIACSVAALAALVVTASAQQLATSAVRADSPSTQSALAGSWGWD